MIEVAARNYVIGEDVSLTDDGTTIISMEMLQAKGYLEKNIKDPRDNSELLGVKVTVSKNGNKTSCKVEDKEIKVLNNNPSLTENMIPIKYDGSKWIKVDYKNTNNSWYNYGNKEWANMATVSPISRETYKKASVGTEVKMEDINAMYVWIPRFRYKLFNVDGTISPVGNINLYSNTQIQVQLQPNITEKDSGTQNGEWLTHPAFTFRGEEIPGFWVGKFENGYDQGTDLNAYTTTGAEQATGNADKVIIKPNVFSWRSENVANINTMVKEIKMC